MARKRDLASKLSQQNEARPGWRDAITGPGRSAEAAQVEEETPGPEPRRAKKKGPLKRKTYLLTPGLIDQVAELAETEQVGINELVRYLLRSSLDMVETGELDIPTKPATRQIVRQR